MKNDQLLYWIWLDEAIGRSGATFKKLLGHFENPRELFENVERVDAIPELSPQSRKALKRRDLGEATAILEACERYGFHVLTYRMSGYPQVLREIPDPPVLLYYVGTLPDFDGRVTFGMVGTRRMSAYGMNSAYRLAYELASADAVIISGLAEGVDGVCAAAAMEAGGTTVAVVGCGLDIFYPVHHAALAREIPGRGGAILSEYPPGTKPVYYHFPVRNRIISGLSQAVIVVEAGVRSGSLITAKEAVVQGRDLLAVPAQTGNPETEGNLQLLRDGASVAISAQDLVDRYRYVFDNRVLKTRVREWNGGADMEVLKRYHVIDEQAGMPISYGPDEPVAPERPANARKAPDPAAEKPQSGAEEPAAPVPDAILQTLSPIQKAVLEAMPDDIPVTAETLKTDYTFGEVLSALTSLELLGIVRKLPGSMYGKR